MAKKTYESSRKSPKLHQRWREMPFFSNENLSKLDWILTTVILTALFFCCVHTDIRLTGNRSFNMYISIRDFYKVCYEQSQAYYANYLPSTFWAFALWNLPLYLTGHIPDQPLTNSIINIMWYKLLPVLIYLATAQILYRIGKKIGFGEKKARLFKFAFLIFPIGVFSQFIFGQYDIFTVFFMVLGFFFYVGGNLWLFALMFGIATTFKYQAVLFFLVLLVLKEKKIRKLILYTGFMAIPFLLEVVPNLNDVYFRRNVFGFVMLKQVEAGFSFGFFGGVNMTAAVGAFFLVWAYLKKTQNKQELVSWAAFLTVGMSFACFGFSHWNPQWLLILVPYVLLNIFLNEYGNTLIMITNALILGLYIYTSRAMVGENVLFSGVLKYLLHDRATAIRMWDVYTFHNEGILLAAVWVVLLCYVVFGHPKFHTKMGNIISRGFLWQMRCAFLFSVAAFVIPMMICVVGELQGRIVYLDNTSSAPVPDNYVMIDKTSSPVQEIVSDGTKLTKLLVCAYTGGEQKMSPIHIMLRSKENGEVIYETDREAYDFSKDGAYYSLLDHPVEVEPQKTYLLELTSTSGKGKGIGLYCINTQSETELLGNGTKKGAAAEAEHETRRLKMKITGFE